ncbi:MAG: hypothetical protein Q4C31_05335, partial [Eubacteriales bacterium]|nr:hypothetical protein [Eubacteriales bacterium]
VGFVTPILIIVKIWAFFKVICRTAEHEIFWGTHREGLCPAVTAHFVKPPSFGRRDNRYLVVDEGNAFC